MHFQNKRRLRMLAIVPAVMALISILPYQGAETVSILGYKAICPFAPLSTVLSFYVFLTLYRYAGTLDTS